MKKLLKLLKVLAILLCRCTQLLCVFDYMINAILKEKVPYICNMNPILKMYAGLALVFLLFEITFKYFMLQSEKEEPEKTKRVNPADTEDDEFE